MAADRSFPTDFQGLLTKAKTQGETAGETAGQTEWPLLPRPVLSLILSTQRCSSNVSQTTSDAWGMSIQLNDEILERAGKWVPGSPCCSPAACTGLLWITGACSLPSKPRLTGAVGLGVTLGHQPREPGQSRVQSFPGGSPQLLGSALGVAGVVPPFLHPGRWEQGEGVSPVWTSLCSSSS